MKLSGRLAPPRPDKDQDDEDDDDTDDCHDGEDLKFEVGMRFHVAANRSASSLCQTNKASTTCEMQLWDGFEIPTFSCSLTCKCV